jgi:hypothetical protein
VTDWTVVLEDAVSAWHETDTDLRIRTIEWLSGFRAGSGYAEGEQVLGIDGLYTKIVDALGVRVTWLVKPHHRAMV